MQNLVFGVTQRFPRHICMPFSLGGWGAGNHPNKKSQKDSYGNPEAAACTETVLHGIVNLVVVFPMQMTMRSLTSKGSPLGIDKITMIKTIYFEKRNSGFNFRNATYEHFS